MTLPDAMVGEVAGAKAVRYHTQESIRVEPAMMLSWSRKYRLE